MSEIQTKINATVEPLGPTSDDQWCDYCSTLEHKPLIEERGLRHADYKLKNTYGVTLAYVCKACLPSFEGIDEVPDE